MPVQPATARPERNGTPRRHAFCALLHNSFSHLEFALSPRFKHTLQSTVVACAAAFGAFIAAQPAQAAYVVVDVDPPFGPAYADLGWRAKGALYIPDSCKAAADISGRFEVMRNTWGDCTGAHLQDVKVDFYNVADISKTTVETLVIGTYEESSIPYYYAPLVQELLDLTFDNGLLTGFHTSVSNWVQAFSAIAGGGDDAFALTIGKDAPVFERGAGLADLSGSNPTRLYSQNQGPSASGSPAATVTVGAYLTDAEYLPEPGSLTLALTALGATLLAGATTRRRKAG